MADQPDDAVTLVDAAGDALDWWPLAGGTLAHREGRGVDGVTIASVAHGTWQLRMLRVDGEDPAHGVRLTGTALDARDPSQVFVTEVDQGLDVCAADGMHSELRILVPWDGRVSIAREGDHAFPQVDVADLPAGFPMIVAVRFGSEPPAVPQVNEVPTDADGKPLRIRQTGSSIPEIELAPSGGGHAISIKWPDRHRQVFELPGR